MASSRTGILVLTVIAAAFVLVGCSDDPAVPEEETVPSLNSGHSFAEWALDGALCEGGQFCLDRVSVSRNRGETPEIHAKVSGEAGSLLQTTAISVEDYEAFQHLIESVIAVRNGAWEGCIPVEGLSERVALFSGDSGHGAQIEGCDEPVVQEVRELAIDLVAKYFTEE